MIKRCPVCRSIFEVAESRLKHGRGVTCSRACQYKANRSKLAKPVACACIGCGQMFMSSPSKLAAKRGAGKYCTRTCRDKHWRGPLNPNWVDGAKVNVRGPNWQAIRRAIVARDGCCQHCGSTEKLHVHHIVPFRLFASHEQANEPDNLITLCQHCHRPEDARYKWVKLDESAGIIRMNTGGYGYELAKQRGML